MPGNLTKSVEDDETWKSLGFGIFGGGLFGVANPSMINGPLSKLSGSTFIQSIDLSKYNMYMADTEERAANLAKFMSQLQKFAIKERFQILQDLTQNYLEFLKSHYTNNFKECLMPQI